MALMVLLERLMSIALVHWVATKSLETIEKCFIHDYAMIILTSLHDSVEQKCIIL